MIIVIMLMINNYKDDMNKHNDNDNDNNSGN